MAFSCSLGEQQFFLGIFSAFSEEEVHMWIAGLNWLMSDTQRAAAPLQTDRLERFDLWAQSRHFYPSRLLFIPPVRNPDHRKTACHNVFRQTRKMNQIKKQFNFGGWWYTPKSCLILSLVSFSTFFSLDRWLRKQFEVMDRDHEGR